MQLTDEQIKHMVDCFLGWKLPADFAPDGGVSFDPIGNPGCHNEYRRTPFGTNLLTAAQAEEMVRDMVTGLPDAPFAIPAAAPIDEFTRKRWQSKEITANHTPETALRVALDAVLTGDIDPDHLIVVYATKDENVEDVPGLGWYQGGKYNHCGQVGLLNSAQFCMNKTYL